MGPFVKLTTSSGRPLHARPHTIHLVFEVEVKADSTGGMPGIPRVAGSTKFETRISTENGSWYSVRGTADEVLATVMGQAVSS